MVFEADTSLEIDDVRRIVESVLNDKLGRFGFARAEVEERRDEDDQRILFIRSVFGPVWSRFTGEESVLAIHQARLALLEKGEDRFPLIVHAFPQDKAA